jgi:hypothetical protein
VALLDGAYARLHRAREHLADLKIREKAILHPQIEDVVIKMDLNAKTKKGISPIVDALAQQQG